MAGPEANRPVTWFDYASPDADIPWQVDELGEGVVASVSSSLCKWHLA